jgi:hypothetical protein
MPGFSARRRRHEERRAVGDLSESLPDRRVPAYLGRVLDADGEPAGTCFQLAPAIVATAWHVLNAVGADALDATVGVDPLAGGESQAGTVVAIDEPADLALVRLTTPLSASIAGLAATDDVAKTEPVDVTGVSRIDDPGHAYRFFDRPGTWGGATLREDAHPLGWMACNIVVPGMSGAPVRRRSDDVVVGVVSGRYNSADGWMRDCVWIARSERLQALCEGVVPVALHAAPVVEPIDLVLSVGATQVRLAGGDVDVRADHGGVSPGLANAVDETRRARANAGGRREVSDDIRAQPGSVALDRAGRLLSQSFLPDPIAAALAERLDRAEAAHQPLRLGIACAEARFERLPWEALADPRTEGPLALRPLVGIHRRVAAAGTPAAVPGPLRILVAIASPDDSSPLLDYERELRNVLTAVRAARRQRSGPRRAVRDDGADPRRARGRGRPRPARLRPRLAGNPCDRARRRQRARDRRRRLRRRGDPGGQDAGRHRARRLLHEHGGRHGRPLVRRRARRARRRGGDRERDVGDRHLRHEGLRPHLRTACRSGRAGRRRGGRQRAPRRPGRASGLDADA